MFIKCDWMIALNNCQYIFNNCIITIISVVDALGKPPSGFLNGNTVFMGSYDTCKTIIGSSNYGSNYKPCTIKATMTVVLIFTEFMR